MTLENAKLSVRLIAAVTCLAFLASCATAPQTARGPEYAPTANIMREARSANVPVEKRAANYLQAAAMTGLLYVAVLIARLVSLYSTAKSNDS